MSTWKPPHSMRRFNEIARMVKETGETDEDLRKHFKSHEIGFAGEELYTTDPTLARKWNIAYVKLSSDEHRVLIAKEHEEAMAEDAERNAPPEEKPLRQHGMAKRTDAEVAKAMHKQVGHRTTMSDAEKVRRAIENEEILKKHLNK